MAEEVKTYKATLHVATGAFSFVEISMEATSVEIIAVNDKLLARYKETKV